MKNLMVCLLFGATSCTAAVDRVAMQSAESNEFAYSAVYDRERESILLSVHSLTSHDLCFDALSWPDGQGRIHFGADLLSASQDGTKLDLVDENFGSFPPGYYPDDIVLPAGGSLTAVVGINRFQPASPGFDWAEAEVTYRYVPHNCLNAAS